VGHAGAANIVMRRANMSSVLGVYVVVFPAVLAVASMIPTRMTDGRFAKYLMGLD